MTARNDPRITAYFVPIDDAGDIVPAPNGTAQRTRAGYGVYSYSNITAGSPADAPVAEATEAPAAAQAADETPAADAAEETPTPDTGEQIAAAQAADETPAADAAEETAAESAADSDTEES